MTRKASDMYTAFKFVECAGGVMLHEGVSLMSMLGFGGTVAGIAGG